MRLVDELLCELIAEMGIDRDTFYNACKESNNNPTHHRVVQQILSVDDFMAFKRMMIRKNIQLSEIALKELTKLTKESKPVKRDTPAGDDDEMRVALELSKRESEQREREAEEEERMIKLAIEASMALLKDSNAVAAKKAMLEEQRRKMEEEEKIF